MSAIKELNWINIADKSTFKAWRQQQSGLQAIYGINLKKSTDVTGLLVTKLPPITRPKMRARTDQIDGRDGDLVTKLGYEAYDKEVELVLYGEYYPDDIIAYLSPPEGGYIVFSDEPDYYYEFEMLDDVGLERLLKFRKGKVKFHVQPYKYRLKELVVLEDDGHGNYSVSVNTGSSELSQENEVDENDSDSTNLGRLVQQILAVRERFFATLSQLVSALNASQSLWMRTKAQLVNWQSVMNCGNVSSVPIYAFKWIPSSDLGNYIELFLHKGYTDEQSNKKVIYIANPNAMFNWLDKTYYGGQYYDAVRSYYSSHDEPVPLYVYIYVDVKAQQCKACICEWDTDPISVLYSEAYPMYSVNRFIRIDDWDRAKLNPLYNLIRVYAPRAGYGGFQELWLYRRSRNL